MDLDLQRAALLFVIVLLVLVLPLEAIGRVVARALDRLHGVGDGSEEEI